MMNVKETLKRLHKKLPAMGLDELFELLDCYVEQSTLTSYPNWDNKIWYSTEKTTGVNETPKVTCVTSKIDPAIYTIASNCTNGEIKYYDGGGSTQLVAEH